jgi:DNA processing protein
MLQNELLHLLALLRVDGVGDIVAKKLLSHFGSAEAIFKAKKKSFLAIDGVGETLYKNFQRPYSLQEAEQELFFLEHHAINSVSYLDSAYPERLKHCIDGPVLLFQSGHINLKSQRLISIVGTRQITSYGIDFTKKLLADLAPLNPVIVSGFAYGVDIVAHQAAMEQGLQTIGVLAHGLNQIYPKTHKKYVAKMEEHGGFMTEFWSTSNPDRENFVKRNRIDAGTVQKRHCHRASGAALRTLCRDAPGVTPKGGNTMNKHHRTLELDRVLEMLFANWIISRVYC